jgi:ATP-dependent Zn protease
MTCPWSQTYTPIPNPEEGAKLISDVFNKFGENVSDLFNKHLHSIENVETDLRTKTLHNQLLHFQDNQIDFDCIIGHEEVKAELKDVMRDLKNPHNELGGSARKGSLLVGPSGSGKTSLAKALAKECKCTFLFISAACLIGDLSSGPEKLREIFAQAREEAPTILFFDEIDYLAPAKQKSLMAQLLVELDGSSQIFVLGATNAYHQLPKALVRSGRLDYVIEVPFPTREERILMLRRFALDLKMVIDEKIKWEEEQALSEGMSGADIRKTLNEACILARRDGTTQIERRHLIQAFLRHHLGAPKKRILKEEELWRNAIHESGHALAALETKHRDLVLMTIEPYDLCEGMVFCQWPDEKAQTRTFFVHEMCVCFGGMCAEQELLGESSANCLSDIQKAIRSAEQMLQSGMFDVHIKVPSVDFFPVSKDLFDIKMNEKAIPHLQHSLNSAKEAATLIMKKNRELLTIIAKELLQERTLTQSQLIEICSRYRASLIGPIPSKGLQ